MATEPHTPSTLTQPRIVVLTLWTVILAVYFPHLAAPFVFDDMPGIVSNPWFRAESPLATIFQGASTRFLSFLTFYVQWLLAGDDPIPFRLVNILLHATNATLVLVLLRKLIPGEAPIDRWLPVSLAFLFALHPLQSQPVIYIHQRFALLVAFAALLSLWLFLHLAEGPRYRYGLWATLILSMFLKQNAIAIPLCLVLFSYVPSASRSHALKTFRQFGWTLLIIPITMLLFRDKEWADLTTSHTISILSPFRYALAQGPIIWSYLRLFAFPMGQSLLRDASGPSTFLTSIFAGLSWLCLVFIATGIYWRRKRWPLAFLGVGFYLLTLFPESSFMPLEDLSFEHRTYLPNFGLLLILAQIILSNVARLPNKVWGGLAVALLVGCLVTLSARLDVWQSPISIWSDAYEKFPDNEKANLNLGIAYENDGAFPAAINIYREALERHPKSQRARLSLASALIQNYDWIEASQLLSSFTSKYPKDQALQALLLGQSSLVLGRPATAVTQLTSLTQSSSSKFLLSPPQYLLAWRLTITALLEAEDMPGAMAAMERYRSIFGDKIWSNLVMHYLSKEDLAPQTAEALPTEGWFWLVLHDKPVTIPDVPLPADLRLALACKEGRTQDVDALLHPTPPFERELAKLATTTKLLGLEGKLSRLWAFCRLPAETGLILDPTVQYREAAPSP